MVFNPTDTTSSNRSHALVYIYTRSRAIYLNVKEDVDICDEMGQYVLYAHDMRSPRLRRGESPRRGITCFITCDRIIIILYFRSSSRTRDGVIIY